MNDKLNPQARDDSQAKSANRKSKKKLYGALGGVALAGAVAFGGGALLGQAPQATAQTTQSTPAASPSPSPTSPGTSTPGSTTPSSSSSASTPGSSTPPATSNKGVTGKSTGSETRNGSKGFGGGEGRGGERAGLSGTISAISGNTITLKRGNVVVIQATVNDSTVYTTGGSPVKLSDLKVGETVNIRTTTATDGTVSISAVEVVLDQAGGTISAIDPTTLTLTRSDKSTVKVTLGSGGTVQDLGKTINFSGLKTGQQVEVTGMLNTDGTFSAQVINVQHDRLGGTVTAISGNTLTVQVGGGKGQGGTEGRSRGKPAGSSNSNGSSNTTPGSGSTTNPSTGSGSASASTTTTRAITVSGSTVYLAGGQTIQLSDIKVGDRIEAVGTLSSDASSITALQVTVQLPQYQGQVTSVNGSTIVIQERGTSRTIEISSTTKYLNGQASASLSDVKTGLNISVEGKVDSSGKMTASVVQLGRGNAAGPKSQDQEQGQED